MKSLLLIDDSAADLAEILNLIGGDRRFTATTAQSFDEALQAIERRPPNLVVIDPNLPDRKSLALIETLRKKHPNVPTIIVSTLGQEEAASRALQAGAASYVPKHLLEQILIPTMEGVLALVDQQLGNTRILRLVTRWDCDFVLENDRSLIAPLVAHLQQYALQLGVCVDHDATRLGIALDEAVTNALYHGNLELSSDLREEPISTFDDLARERAQQLPYASRRIRVGARMTQTEAEFIIEDEGPGFDPSHLPDPTDPANLDRVCGRGVLLMRTFMDEVVYSDRGNRVTMRKAALSESLARLA